ncbi:very short patch repair endonuclease [Bailinhaonella thermotolerans]|uniref:Very short patch repair endonuclease n=1 Tax=Bailinhaonella thermotolerans TaxID=1070861 RepID=A0A3A4AUD5_9ACTN|nr:very short patch repair endonuclease [Bailinhaonella thermotolerans]
MTSGEGRWKDKPPPPRAWKGRARTREGRSAEQDRAAGGHEARYVDLGDGRRACASIELKVYTKTRRIRAYLRWSDKGKSPALYVGEVDHETRAENLAAAWRAAHAQGLLAPPSASPVEFSWASSPAVRQAMKANRSRDTRPERRLRSAVHALGLRYRVARRPLAEVRRTADLVFTKAKVAVFVDGCYWHGCPEPAHYRPSQKNFDFWHEKISANQRRDQDTNMLLAKAGWTVIRIWEHEEVSAAAARIAAVVRGASSTRSSSTNRSSTRSRENSSPGAAGPAEPRPGSRPNGC